MAGLMATCAFSLGGITRPGSLGMISASLNTWLWKLHEQASGFSTPLRWYKDSAAILIIKRILDYYFPLEMNIFPVHDVSLEQRSQSVNHEREFEK